MTSTRRADPGSDPASTANSAGAPAGSPGVVYRQYLEAGVLAFQRCGQCAATVFPPRVLCPSCGSQTLAWEQARGSGVVYSTTTVHVRGADPYNVSLIDLTEGHRMMSNVVDVPPEAVHIGMPVRVTIDRSGADPLPLFGPEES